MREREALLAREDEGGSSESGSGDDSDDTESDDKNAKQDARSAPPAAEAGAGPGGWAGLPSGGWHCSLCMTPHSDPAVRRCVACNHPHEPSGDLAASAFIASTSAAPATSLAAVDPPKVYTGVFFCRVLANRWRSVVLFSIPKLMQ